MSVRKVLGKAEEKLEESLLKTVANIKQATAALTHFRQGLQFIGDFKKSMGSAIQLFKEIKSASYFTTEILSVFEGFNPLASILEVFQPVLDMISGLFAVMGAEIVPVLLEVLKPFLALLRSLMPIFKVIGKVIGILLQVALIPLRIIFEVLAAVIEPLMPIIQPLIDILEVVGNVISWVINDPLAALEIAFKAIAWVIIAIINGIIIGVNTVMEVLTLGFWTSIPTIPLPTFDEGGRALVDMTAKVQAGEYMITGNQMEQVEELLEKQNKILTQQLNKPAAPIIRGKY